MTMDGKRNVLLGSRVVSVDPTGGIQCLLWDRIAVRAGFHTVQRIPGRESGQWGWGITPTLGMGLRLERLQIDYAILNAGNANIGLPSHVVSLQLEISGEGDRHSN